MLSSEESINFAFKYSTIESKISFENNVVNIEGSVNISFKDFKKIPIKFGIVTGDFRCYGNMLVTLKNSPSYVGGEFDCRNNQLLSLLDGPKIVKGDFHCDHNNLTTLEGCPKEIGGRIFCTYNNFQHIGHLLTCKIEGKIHADQKLLDEYNFLKNQVIEF